MVASIVLFALSSAVQWVEWWVTRAGQRLSPPYAVAEAEADPEKAKTKITERSTHASTWLYYSSKFSPSSLSSTQLQSPIYSSDALNFAKWVRTKQTLPYGHFRAAFFTCRLYLYYYRLRLPFPFPFPFPFPLSLFFFLSLQTHPPSTIITLLNSPSSNRIPKWSLLTCIYGVLQTFLSLAPLVICICPCQGVLFTAPSPSFLNLITIRTLHHFPLLTIFCTATSGHS